MKISQPITECQKCGGPVYDNRGRKKNPKGPDFACKDRQGCGEGFWLPAAQQHDGPKNGAGPRLPELSPAAADKLMVWCWGRAERNVEATLAKQTMSPAERAVALVRCIDAIQAQAATLYISLTPSARAGQQKAQTPPPPPPRRAPPPPEPEPEYASGGSGYDDERELPF